MNFAAPQFIPSGQDKYDRPTLIAAVIMITGCGLGFMITALNRQLIANPVINIILFIAIAPLLSMAFINMKRFKPLNGAFAGELIIDENSVSFSGRKILFSEISNIEFVIFDYYGTYIGDRNSRSIHPSLSQGVGNYIKMTTSSGEKITIYFKLLDKDDHLRLVPIMSQLIAQNKIPFLKGISMLNLNYKQVQELKEQIAKLNVTV
jgi:hypothetical protein